MNTTIQWHGEDFYKVHGKSLNNLQNVSLELVNSLGELVSDKKLGESKGELNESFDLSNQPSGIYLLRILLDDKLITRKVTLN